MTYMNIILLSYVSINQHLVQSTETYIFCYYKLRTYKYNTHWWTASRYCDI